MKRKRFLYGSPSAQENLKKKKKQTGGKIAVQNTRKRIKASNIWKLLKIIKKKVDDPCLLLFIIWERQIKTIIKYYFYLLEWQR